MVFVGEAVAVHGGPQFTGQTDFAEFVLNRFATLPSQRQVDDEASHGLVPGKDGEHSPFADELWRNESIVSTRSGRARSQVCSSRCAPRSPALSAPPRGRATMALALRSGSSGDFVGCTSYAWGQAHHCGFTERRCQACGEGIMARQPPSHRTAKCQNPKCGTEAPLCRCDVPKPMVLRTSRENGSTFYGCQSYELPPIRLPNAAGSQGLFQAQ